VGQPLKARPVFQGKIDSWVQTEWKKEDVTQIPYMSQMVASRLSVACMKTLSSECHVSSLFWGTDITARSNPLI
jgi:hypothetical protein